MKLKNFSFFLFLLIVFLNSPINSEEKIDIWKKDKKKETTGQSQNQSKEIDLKNLNFKPTQTIEKAGEVQIEEGTIAKVKEQTVYGIYDPANFNFNLNMWSTTSAEDVRSSLKRLNKINLSISSSEILETILLSFSYPPKGMSEEEFVNLKINWLIANDRGVLIEKFLKQNEEFDGKKKAVQFLVDKNIASANIKEGCKKIRFIDASIKDAYLENLRFIV